MPYRIVLDKLRMGASRIVESLSPGIVREVVETLFPSGAGGLHVAASPVQWDDALAITGEEIGAVFTRINLGRAPGPDGIIGRVIRNTSDILVKRWMSCFTACLREGVFPSRWKMARLVLLKKPGKPDRMSSYRPICLLSEAGKLLERVISNRLTQCLDESGGISESQFGFRS